MKPNLATFPESSDYHGYEEWTEAIKKWKREFGGALRQLFKQEHEIARSGSIKDAYYEHKLTMLEKAVFGDAEASP